jgi:hypothetical protein
VAGYAVCWCAGGRGEYCECSAGTTAGALIRRWPEEQAQSCPDVSKRGALAPTASFAWSTCGHSQSGFETRWRRGVGSC